MTIHTTEIDWSGKYVPRASMGLTITNADGSKIVQFGSKWAVIDNSGKVVTEIGAVVMFESQQAAGDYLRGIA